MGVFQELLKTTCQESGVLKKAPEIRKIDDLPAFSNAIKRKTEEYSGRHLRNLEAIASGFGSLVQKDAPLPYFLHYYIVMHILTIGYEGFNGGISKEALMHELKQVHHRKEDLKGSLLTAALKSLTEVQSGKGISPPVIAYDSNSRQLKIVDSTFYFFLKNANLKEVKEEIVCPMDAFDS